jgi:hypothetical protein
MEALVLRPHFSVLKGNLAAAVEIAIVAQLTFVR